MRAYDSNGMVSPSCSGNIAMYTIYPLLITIHFIVEHCKITKSETDGSLWLNFQGILTGTTGERENTVSRSHRLMELEALGVKLRSFSITCDIYRTIFCECFYTTPDSPAYTFCYLRCFCMRVYAHQNMWQLRLVISYIACNEIQRTLAWRDATFQELLPAVNEASHLTAFCV